MLASLRKEVGAHLKSPILLEVVTIPHLVALYFEYLEDGIRIYWYAIRQDGHHLERVVRDNRRGCWL